MKYYYMSMVCLCALEAFCFGSAANAQTIEGTQSQAPVVAAQQVASASNIGSDADASKPADPSRGVAQVRLVPTAPPSDFSVHGITLYGGIDLGFGYQSHGTPFNGAYGPGDNYLISKNSNGSRFGAAPNALSYSDIGLRGSEPILPGLSAIFNLSNNVQPLFWHVVRWIENLGSEQWCRAKQAVIGW